MNVVFLQFTLRDQGRLHRAKLCALWDASLGEHPAQEAINIEDQRQTGTRLGQHRPIGYGVQRAVLQARRRVGSITLLTP